MYSLTRAKYIEFIPKPLNTSQPNIIFSGKNVTH